MDIAIKFPTIHFKRNDMNVKRIFGTILTVLGIGGLIYTGTLVVQQSTQVRALIVVGIIFHQVFPLSEIRKTKNDILLYVIL